jgi:hypothetical protein
VTSPYPDPVDQPPIDPWLTTNHALPAIPPPLVGQRPPPAPQVAPVSGGVAQPVQPPARSPAAGAPPANGLAAISLALGILGVATACCTLGAFSLAAVICGHVALRQIRRTGARGHDAAVWGLVLGYPAIIVGVIVTVMWGFEQITNLG